jgi:type IV pilus assembly protein PilN
MRISVNLATRPFVELRPIFLRLRIAMVLLAAVAIALGLWAHAVQQRLNRATAQMDSLRYQTNSAQQERLHNEARMRQGPNAAVLDRAHFLNRTFLEKSFSWTAVMMDLENVLPTGVQVTSIEPQVSASGDVVIRLRVSGERDRAVQLVRNLEHSRRFLQPRLSGEASQAKENVAQRGGLRQPQMNVPTAPPGVEFDILANYNPLPEGESYTKPSSPKKQSSPKKPSSPKHRSGAGAVRGGGR